MKTRRRTSPLVKILAVCAGMGLTSFLGCCVGKVLNNTGQPYKELPIIEGVTDNEKAKNALDYVVSNIQYEDDWKQYNSPDYWATSKETMENKKGDCEDGAFLLRDILLKNGMREDKLKIGLGLVQAIGPFYNGHAYLLYKDDGETQDTKDDRWVVLDWCYKENSKPIKERETFNERKDYKTLFTINTEIRR